MDIKIKLDKNFTTQFNKMLDTYGEKMAQLNGFSMAQLSYTDFIDNFVDKQTVADVSIDGNSNVGHKDIVTLENEMSKPHSKLLCFNKIYYEMNKTYGYARANAWVENEWDGHFYLHDFYNSTLKSYCFAYDLEQLVNEGLFFIENFNHQPPKHLNTYTDFVGEFVSWNCNRTSGAVGLPSFLIYSYYFWQKDIKCGNILKSPEYYRDQNFQEIIYKLNQPYLRGGVQSAFTNFSIFDKEYLVALFGGKQFPDGTFIIDYIDEILEYQKAFMEVCSEIRSQNMMTFPVLSFALLRKNGKFVDEDFAKWCCKHNMKWCDSNFFISSDVTSLSNCCFSGKQMCLTRSTNGVNLMAFKDLYDSPYNENKHNLTILHNGSWVKGKIIKLPVRDMYKVTTANKKEMYITDNHITPTLQGDKLTTELSTDDYVLFNNMKLDTFTERDLKLSYEQGFLIGMYLGDGSISDSNSYKSSCISLSINETKYNQSIDILNKALKQWQIDANINLGKEYNNVYPITINSIKLRDIIKTWTNGNYCYEKELNLNSLEQSVEFRNGIVDGYYLTDGGNSNRIYTTSEKLVYQMETLFTSLGKHTIIDITDRTEEPVIIRGKTFKRNYPLYCIRWYEHKNKRNFKGNYIVKNNSTYFKIESIEKIDYDDEFVYCFEMNNKEEPYFTLPNGIITHNCRLVSDVKDLGYFNSLGGTALEVGSVKVNTINLARISYESNTQSEYLEILKDKVLLCLQCLDVIRHIISRNVEKGLLPNYKLGIINLKSQYNTIGIIGIYETLEKFGLTQVDQFGNTTYTDEGIEFAKDILKTITDIKNEFVKEKDYSVNIEEVPAERCAYILMEKDKQFYPDQIYKLPLYGNQWIPLGVKTTLNEKIRLSAILDKACSGGSIAHINLESPITNFDTAWNLLNHIADSGVPYFAFCTKISACKHNHGFYGEICSECGEPKETTYQRIVGFLTPEKTYSKERKSEFQLRDWLDADRMSEI